MNKWMKQGLVGLAMTTASVATIAAVAKEAKPAVKTQDQLMVDAQDYIPGAKLKDRMITSSTFQDIAIVTLKS